MFAPQPDGRAVSLWSDLAASVDAIRGCPPRRHLVRRVRPARAGPRAVPRRSGRRGAARDPDAGLRRRAPGPAARARVPRAGQGRRTHDPARARGGGRRLRRGVVRHSGGRGRRSPGAASATRRWARGRRERPRCCSRTRPATTAGRRARRSSPAAVRRRSPTRSPRRPRRPGRRSGPPRGSRRSSRSTAWPRASCSRAARRSRRPAIVSGVDPKRLLTGLVEPVTLGPSLRWRAANIRTPGTVAKVNLVARRPARVPGRGRRRPSAARAHPGGTTSIEDVERAFDASKYGRISDSPVLEATIPSLVDPSLVAGAAGGTQVMSVLMQWLPPKLGGRRVGGPARRGRRPRHPDARDGVARAGRPRDRAPGADAGRPRGRLRADRRAPAARRARARLVLPVAAAARLGALRMPVEGLYLAGSGAHPGGGVTGVPGRNAAREVLADAKRRRR